MGLFDSVWVDCPNCGASVEFQSKAGECALHNYTLADAPPEILSDVMNEPDYCEKCGQWFALIDPQYPPGQKPKPDLRTAKVRTPENPRTHPQGMKWWPDDKPFTADDVEPSNA